MRILDLDILTPTPILEYESADAVSASIGQGSGNSHVYWLRFKPGGVIRAHPAGSSQLLIPLEGRGWAAGPDAVRQPIARGQIAFFASGEVHSKGSEEGMAALMIQISTLDLELR